MTKSKVRVNAFSLSLDGYGAGPDQSLEHPLGVGGEALHEWLFHKPEHEIDGAVIKASFENVGAWILGRNMFGPVRGPWPDFGWKGWWGPNPPFHCPVFVLTHHPRESVAMEGGTTFHFVTDGVPSALVSALERARAAAGDKDILIGGGSSTIRQYLTAGLIDELQLAVAPVLLGRGEPSFAGLDFVALGYQVASFVSSPNATHYKLVRR